MPEKARILCHRPPYEGLRALCPRSLLERGSTCIQEPQGLAEKERPTSSPFEPRTAQVDLCKQKNQWLIQHHYRYRKQSRQRVLHAETLPEANALDVIEPHHGDSVLSISQRGRFQKNSADPPDLRTQEKTWRPPRTGVKKFDIARGSGKEPIEQEWLHALPGATIACTGKEPPLETMHLPKFRE